MNQVTKTTLTLGRVRNATYPIPDISRIEVMKVIGCRHMEIQGGQSGSCNSRFEFKQGVEL
jgi:hypothetical protein